MATRTTARFIPPMKALGVKEIPAGDWHFEIKFDGYRAIAVLNKGKVDLWSRNVKPLTEDYPEVVEALENVKCRNAVLDGEIVALDAEGRSRFQLLQRRSADEERPNIGYFLFDLLLLDGESYLDRPIEERQAALAKLIKKTRGKVLTVSPVLHADPAELLKRAREQGLEGIVAKKPGSAYEPDRRSGTWLKCRVTGEQEFVIGGFTPPNGSRPNFGSILLGYYSGKKLIYCGKVGSGFDHKLLKSLYAMFLARKTSTCPFSNLPMPRKPRFGLGMTAAAMREVTWIKPQLVCQVRFVEWTSEGQLRQPVFLGLRKDKPARDVVREAPPAAEAD